MKREIELKYRLASRQDFYLFERFLEKYRCDKKEILLQENSYFDTPDLELRKAGISFRLRRQNKEHILCAKQSLAKQKAERNLSVRLEYEGKLDKPIAALICDDHLSPLDAFLFLRSKTDEEENTKKILYRHMKKAVSTDVQIIGSFTNVRINFPITLLNQEVVLELDHTIYPNNIEIFEVEVELAGVRQVAQFRPAIEGLFRSAGLRTQRSSSKSSRLYRILFS